MRLEDAFLQVVLDLGQVQDPVRWIHEAIAGGGDLICVRGAGHRRDVLADMVAACREDDALVVVADDPVSAAAVKADGVFLSCADAEIGQARTVVGVRSLVGMFAASVDDAKLAILLGADFLVCDGELGGHAAASLRVTAAGPLYVSVDGVDGARELVDSGVLRFSVPSHHVAEKDVKGALAEYSRLLGRCI